MRLIERAKVRSRIDVMSNKKNTMSRYLCWLKWAVVHPTWAFHHAKGRLYNRDSYMNKHRRRTKEYQKYSCSIEQAIAQVNASQIEYVSFLFSRFSKLNDVNGQMCFSPIFIPFGATSNLASACYVMCRLLQPSIVLETGVGYGITSSGDSTCP